MILQQREYGHRFPEVGTADLSRSPYSVPARVWNSGNLKLFILLCLGMLMGLTGPRRMAAAGTPVPETQLKAAWLLNFAKLSQWPDDAFSSLSQPIDIVVLEDAALAEQLEKSLEGKVAHDRTLRVRHVRSAEDVGPCHVSYLGAIDPSEKKDMLKSLERSPVLTIDDSEKLADSGIILKFLRIDNKIRFEIDLDAANAAQMKMNPKLLQVAHSVKGKRHEKQKDSP